MAQASGACSEETFEAYANDVALWSAYEGEVAADPSVYEQTWEHAYGLAVEMCHSFLEARAVECSLGYAPACEPLKRN